jgi:hypothetical protein
VLARVVDVSLVVQNWIMVYGLSPGNHQFGGAKADYGAGLSTETVCLGSVKVDYGDRGAGWTWKPSV